MKEKTRLKLSCKFDLDNVEQINPEFFRVKIWVCAAGKNRNNSFISKETIESALYSLKNIPVIGFWDKNESDFTTHSSKAIPYGVVFGNDNEFTWETIDVDGTPTEYIVAYAYIWLEFLPKEMLDDSGNLKAEFEFNQSMEIQVLSYSVDEDGVVKISKFVFSALTILSKNVEPAFEEARMEMFSLNEFADKFNLMLNKLYFNYKKKEEGMPKEIQDKKTEKFSLTNSQIVESLYDSLKEVKYEDKWGYMYRRYHCIDFKDDVVFCYDSKEDWKIYGLKFSINGDKISIDFESAAKKRIEFVDYEDGDSADDKLVFSFDAHIGDVVDHVTKIEKAKFEKLEIENATKEADMLKLKENFEKISGEFESEKSEHKETKAKYEAIESEVGELQSLRKTDLFARFEKLIGDTTEYTDMKEKADTLTYSYIETQLLLTFSKKELAVREGAIAKFSLDSKKKKDDSLKAVVPQEKYSLEAETSYGGLLNKYKKQ